MNGFIMAAGLGTRLAPFTRTLPKPLFPAGGAPFLDRGARLAASCGVSRLAVNLHHLGGLIRARAAEQSEWGMEIVFSEERQILGTGGGARRAAELLGRDSLLIIGGDVAADLDPAAFAASHRESGAAATVAVAIEGETARYGGITVSESGRVADMAGIIGRRRGQPIEGRVIVNASVYIIAADLLPRLPGPGGCLVRDFFIPLLESEVPINAYVHPGLWVEGGDPALLLDANRRLLDFGGNRQPAPGCLPAGDLETRCAAFQNGGVRIVEPVFIDPAAAIGPGAAHDPHAVVSAGCRLGDGCSVEHSVLLPGAAAAPGERIISAVRDARYEWSAAAGLRRIAPAGRRPKSPAGRRPKSPAGRRPKSPAGRRPKSPGA